MNFGIIVFSCSNILAVVVVLSKFFLIIIMLVDYGIPVVNLKIVFLPLLAFEVIILIDNFRYYWYYANLLSCF